MSSQNKRKHESEENDDSKRFKSDVSTQSGSNMEEKGMIDMPDEMLLKIFSYLGRKDMLSATLVKKKWNNLITNDKTLMKRIQTNYKEEKGMNDMPNEILLKIFSYLGQKDMLSATLVKKKWGNLITNDRKMMKKIQTIYINTENLIAGIPKFTRPYTSVLVNNVKLECDLVLFCRLKKIKNGIETVVFNDSMFLGNALTTFLKFFKNIKHLCVTGCEVTYVDIQREIKLKELETLHLDYYTWPLSLIKTPKLKELCLGNMANRYNQDASKDILDFLNQQTQLEVLKIYRCCDFLESTNLLPRFRLKVLKLIYIHYDTHHMINILSLMTESLEVLEIRSIFRHDDIIEFVLKQFVNLKSLSIDATSLPVSSGFYNNSIKTPQTLKIFEISGRLYRTKPILQFLSNHPEIETLDLSNLSNIPPLRHSFWSRLAGVTRKVSTLDIETLDADNIGYINHNNLKDFRIELLKLIDIPNWIEFCRNNQTIECLHICDTTADDLLEVEAVLFELLPNLKDFSVDRFQYNFVPF